MKTRDIIPSVLAVLAFNTPEKPELEALLSAESIAALRHAEESGFLHPSGQPTVATGRLYACLNRQFQVIARFVDQKGIGAAYADAWRASLPDAPPPPSLASMAGSFLAAATSEAVAIALGDSPLTDEDLAERRATCLACPWISDPQEESPSCTRCRCPLKRKLKWRSQKCPMGKW